MTDTPPETNAKTKEPEAEKRGPGRPKAEKPEIKELPAKKARYEQAFDLLGVGDGVAYYNCGSREDDPLPAKITAKHKGSRCFDLTVWAPGDRSAHATVDGIRHIDDPDYSEPNRKENGAWEPTLQTKMLMDLINARSN